MARELTPAEIDEMLGAYALDALADGEERAQVEQHLDRSPTAREEVAELHEVAALLAASGSPAPPDGLWEKIEAALGAEPPRLVLPPEGRPPTSIAEARARRGIGLRVAAGLAAASAVAAAVTAFVVSGEMSQQEDRLALVEARVDAAGTRRAAMAAMADPDARMAYLEPTGEGGASATVVAMPSGDGYLMAEDLPALGPGRTYQLWAMTGSDGEPTIVPTAILGRRVGVVAFHVPDTSRGFLITAEAAPGSASPQRPKVLAGDFA